MRRKRRPPVLIPEAYLDSHQRDFPGALEPVATQVMFALRAVAQRVTERANAWLAPFGLTGPKFSYLAVLYATRRTGIALNEIGAQLHTSNATVTSMIDALERDGLAGRSPHPRDRRSTVVTPTEKGCAVFEEAFVVHHREIDALMAGFSPEERSRLLDLLVRLGDALGEEADPPPGGAKVVRAGTKAGR